nr:septation ring formation regulator EzrA [Brevibacillus invocatus]
MLCLAGMLLYTNPVFATPFPEKTDQVVQDQDQYLKSENTANFIEALKDMPGEYKVVVVESTSPEADSPDVYAQKLYDNFNLPDNAMMIVLNMDTEELGVFAGLEFQQKGATMELIHDKIASYFVPFRNQKQYLNGIQTFILELNMELERQQNKPMQPAQAATDQPEGAQEEEASSSSLLSGIPWWIYLIGVVFAGLSIALVYAMIRRRSIFTQVDDVEDWKDELVEKIHVIEVEKPLRRSSGMTEVRYHQLADKKENLLRIRVPDIEMMILDAEEACDRFRFALALGMLEEAREALTLIEQELAELKEDTTKVAVTKQETKVVVPEIGKLVEQVERRLSDMRLDYGLSFHELKATLDEVETMRSLVKTARAAGDDVHAYETTIKAQKILEGMVQSLEQVPAMVDRVKKELPREFKQLEEGIDQATQDGFDVNMDGLDNAMMQAKQLLSAANSALEEGNLQTVNTHVKAFEVLIETTYQGLEEAVIAKKQAAAASAALVKEQEKAKAKEEIAAKAEDITFPTAAPVIEEVYTPVPAVEHPVQPVVEEQIGTVAPVASVIAPAAEQIEERIEELLLPERETFREVEFTEPQPVQEPERYEESISQAEREVLFAAKPNSAPQASGVTEQETAYAAEEQDGEEEEYELVIPKQPQDFEEEEVEEQNQLVIETEDDALDELERISNTLIRLRQQIKRSYLPGLPEHLKYMFEEVVQTLAHVKAIMEQYRYDLEEVAILLQDASDQLEETERVTERVISTCQLAEGAIQYTNRYRRQNRQVNELLIKAEQSFRQLAFAEAYQLAEDARLVVEGAPPEPESGWLLRRKKKG